MYVDEVRMCDGRRFQADGAATEKELLESWRLNRGTIKSPRDVDLSFEFSRLLTRFITFNYFLLALSVSPVWVRGVCCVPKLTHSVSWLDVVGGD